MMGKNEANIRTASKGRAITYWVSTILVAANLGVGAVIDTIQIPYLRKMALHLGYPGYMFVNIAIWEVLGMIALLVPGYPRLKEWAYAGAFFLFSGGVFSHLAVGDGISYILPP